MSERKPVTLAVTRERRLILLAVGALGVSCVMAQLALLALAIAGYAMLLAFLLPQLNRVGDTLSSLVLIKTAVGLLTLILAVKGFDEDTSQKLNSGKLSAILATLKTLKALGVWVEIINLVVPTCT